MTDNYILNDAGEPVVEPDVLAWATWFETADRVVGKTSIGESRISTVFIGIDHSFGSEGPPLLYETMVFGGKLNEEQMHYATHTEAHAGHTEMVRRVMESTE